ncbi:protein Skeletor, isoforms B/C-like [Amphiura filiformis]|uniref:protein Skeletor, isoforms B/C-like n=1 Tax=Amphiura filiformis TaxID=82378 RepID=UPI003B20D393
MADENGWPALDENWSPQQFPSVSFTGKTVIVTLPGEDTIFDVDYIGVWCRSVTQDFGHVLIPDLKAMNIAVPPYVEDEGAYYGADLGAFSGDGAGSTTLHGVDGTVFAIDDTRIKIIGFSYDGAGPDAYIYVGSTPEPSADGMIAAAGGSMEILGAYTNEDIIVTLPEGTTINDFKWISVWCRQAVANFGHVVIPDTFQAPAEHNLGQMLGFAVPLHAVTADAVYVVDMKTLRIENLNYDGLAPDTHYWAGEGMPDSNGFPLLNEDLRSFRFIDIGKIYWTSI